MENRLLNEKFIKLRSEELQIPFENLVAAAVLEEIVERIAESKYAKSFWMKNSTSLNLENYRKKVNLCLLFFIYESENILYKESVISELFSELFCNNQLEAIHWNYTVRMDFGIIYVDIMATFSSMIIPVKMKLELLKENNIQPFVKDVKLFLNNNKKVQIHCFPSEYVIAEKFLEILDKLELLNDLSYYMDIYTILKKDILSGRKVWEFLLEGCNERGIEMKEKRFELLISYRKNRFMKNKWKAYLRRTKRKQPEWDDVMELIERFFRVIWDHLCRNVIYLGDWMPELGRCMD